MFNPPRKQAVPAIAAATASQRKGLRQLLSAGRSSLKVRPRYATNALVNPKAAPAPNTIIASAMGLIFPPVDVA